MPKITSNLRQSTDQRHIGTGPGRTERLSRNQFGTRNARSDKHRTGGRTAGSNRSREWEAAESLFSEPVERSTVVTKVMTPSYHLPKASDSKSTKAAVGAALVDGKLISVSSRVAYRHHRHVISMK